ncbi:50S ribosomal protein L29 [Marinicella sp. S1101]|uniref:50S ribosomal protein L29 n=1 Tax=Marinicella marina TaxID=2996016 RepID=UPI002260BA2F|nr:50S ribosomal protein L29 [Marinicella marina]MCX7555096.1 50S ribosomal protein L29 [Marinicella marina]MDJ1140305.1 50S ribosomal protein L29 [Marinicella marina]
MQAKELRNKDLAELQEELNKLLQQQFDLRMARGNGQLTKLHLMRDVRRNIARVRTVMNQVKG